MRFQPQPVGPTRASLGEGPVWDAARGRLIWVDILGERLIETELATGDAASRPLGGNPGCAVLEEGGDWVVAIDTALWRLPRRGGEGAKLAELPSAGGRLRFNDGKVDPAGRLWIGTMDREEREALGSLYRFDAAAGAFVETQAEVTVSNGLGWSPCGQWMYYIDSPRRAVWRYGFDLATGEIGARTTVAEFDASMGFPDGMAVDADGRLWVAFWGGAAVRCLDPVDGRTLEEIPFPVSKVTSCAFGGPGLDDLLVTTASVDVDRDAEPLAGALFRVPSVSLGMQMSKISLGKQ